MKFLVLFVLFFTSISVFAQTTDKFAQLEQKLKATTTDSSRADALNAIAWEYIKVNPEKGLLYSKESVELCEKHGYRKLTSSCYNTLANLHEELGQFQQAEYAYKESIRIKKDIRDMKGLATVYSNLAKVKRKTGKYEEGLDLLSKSIVIQDSLNNYYGLGLAYTNKGTILKDLGDAYGSVENHKKAMYYREKVKDSLGMAYSAINIGGMLYDLGNYTEGIEITLKGLKYLERTKDYPARTLALNNLAIAYLKVKNKKLAKYYNKQSLNLSYETESYQNIAGALQTKGEILMGDEQFKEALAALKEGESYVSKYKQKFIETEIIGNIGACYYKLKEYNLAERYLKRATEQANMLGLSSVEFRCLMKQISISLDKEISTGLAPLFKRGLDLAKKMNSKRLYLDYYKNSIRYNQLTNKKEALIKDYETYFKYRDSIMPEEAVSSMTDAGIRYETDKKNQAIQLLKQERRIKSLEIKEKNAGLERRALWIWFLLGMGVLVLISALFFIRLQGKVARKNQELAIKETEEQERSRMAKDLHDDLGSGLAKIRFLSDSLPSEQNEEVMERKIKGIQQTAHQLVDNMRDMIWVMNTENNTLFHLSSRIREYISDYLEETSLTCVPQFYFENEGKTLTTEISRTVFSIVKECLQNTLKHAEATEFVCELRQRGKEIEIKLSDNGKGGFDPEKTNGNGMKNIQKRVRLLGGNMNFSSENGTSFHIRFSL